MESVQQITQSINKVLSYIENDKILNAVVGMLLVLYAAMAAPKLPKSIARHFDNSYFKIGFMAMIAYLAHRDPSTAIITAVALFVTLQALSSDEAVDKIVKAVKPKEKFMEFLQSTKPESKLDVPLSPKSKDELQKALDKATSNAAVASKAMSENKPAKAEAAQAQAVLQQVKAEAVVKAAELKQEAKVATIQGKQEIARELEKSAATEKAKVELVNKLEGASPSNQNVKAIVDAKQAKDTALASKDQPNAKALAEEAAKKEVKVQAIAQSEAMKSAAVKAEAKGETAKAELLKSNAIKQEVIAVAATKAEVVGQVAKQEVATGDAKLAQALLKEAAKNDTIIKAVVSAQASKKAALTAKAMGQRKKAKSEMNQA